MYYLYWIRYESFDCIQTQGYVGITGRSLNYRFREHSNSHCNNLVKSAIANGAFIEQIFSGSKQECLELENQLRPNKNIGWNFAIGGIELPVQKGRVGKTPSAEAREKTSKALKGRKKSKQHLEALSVARKGLLAGTKSPSSKLTETDIPLIRERFKLGESSIKISKAFKVSDVTIRLIVRGKTWTHV